MESSKNASTMFCRFTTVNRGSMMSCPTVLTDLVKIHQRLF